MVNQTDTLARLNNDKEMEDKLASDILDYFITSLDGILDLSDEGKKKIRASLSQIASDSQGHSHMFNMLVQMVMENGEDNY